MKKTIRLLLILLLLAGANIGAQLHDPNGVVYGSPESYCSGVGVCYYLPTNPGGN